MKKALLSAFLGVLAAFGILFALPAAASVIGVGYGDLIKLQDDHDPATTSDKVVYYLDSDWKRHPFPNLQVFHSWYFDFLNLKEITPVEMAEFRMGGPIRYRPGTRLVKLASIPKVYAVEPGGSLRWVTTEAVAKSLYGADWAKRVDDVDEAFFGSYHEGLPIVAPLWPTGSVVRRASDGATFFIDGMHKRPLSESARSAVRVFARQIIMTDDDLSAYAVAAPVVADDFSVTDTAEVSRIETLPPTAFTFPDIARDVAPGREVTLARFDVQAGATTTLRGFSATFSGPIAADGKTLLSNVRVTDETGEDLFGTQQLDATSPALTFSGAFAMKENSSHALSITADVDEGAKGVTYGIVIARTSLKLADGGNGNALTAFWPVAAVPSFAVQVR